MTEAVIDHDAFDPAAGMEPDHDQRVERQVDHVMAEAARHEDRGAVCEIMPATFNDACGRTLEDRDRPVAVNAVTGESCAGLEAADPAGEARATRLDTGKLLNQGSWRELLRGGLIVATDLFRVLSARRAEGLLLRFEPGVDPGLERRARGESDVKDGWFPCGKVDDSARDMAG